MLYLLTTSSNADQQQKHIFYKAVNLALEVIFHCQISKQQTANTWEYGTRYVQPFHMLFQLQSII